MLKPILKLNKNIKLQSAMEYLITYGWAILILAIALIALFILGVFNSSGATGQICQINQGFSCLNYYMNTTGVLVLTVTQTGSNYINITSIGCSSDTNNQYLVHYTTPSEQPYIPYGDGYTFTVQCYTSTGKPSINIGSAFSGFIYINYVNDVTGFPGSAVGSFVIKPKVSTPVGMIFQGQSYIPITLTNQQSSGTTSGFQQMINFNPSTYSSDEMTNLSNIEFTSGAPIGSSGSVPLYSWIESGASATAPNTAIWVNLGSVILGSTQNYITVNVINSQNTATGTDFQQMIYFNPSSYSSYEASDLGNIRFYNGNNELYSWCESGCTSTSSNAVFWINTGSLNIGPNSYATVNMIFEPTSTEYDGVYAGEAPQLSPSYAEYDNGANVFAGYWNFKGISLPTGWAESGDTSNIIVNNGITMNIGAGGWSWAQGGTSYNPGNYIIDTYIPAVSCSQTIGGAGWGVSGTVLTSWTVGYCSGSDFRSQLYSNSGGFTYSTFEPFLSNSILSVYSTSSEAYFLLNYGNIEGYTTDFSPSTSSVPAIQAYDGDKITVQFMDVRELPPNGVMPTFQLSGVNTETSGQNTATIYLNFLPNNSPVTTGYMGYAPQLYCTSGCFQTSYAQYDNGASVFNFYNNFAGTSLPTGWDAYDGYPVNVISNGLTIETPSGYDTGIAFPSERFSVGNILDVYGSDWQSSGTGYIGFGYGACNEQGDWITGGSSTVYGEQDGCLAGYHNPSPSISSTSANGIYSLAIMSQTVDGFSHNYGPYQYTALSSNGITYPAYIVMTVQGITNPIYVQYIRIRNLPPNEVMPSVSFGNIN